MVEELKSGTYKDLCSTCGIDKNKPRDLVILDCNPLSYALDLDSRCPECEHYASGQTLLSLKEWKYKLINKAEERGRKEGAITELEIIIKRNSNFKYSRLDMIEFCEKRLNKLQSGETK